MFSANFNNKNSCYDLNLRISHRPNIPVAEKNIKNYEIEGRDGNLTEKLGYKDIEIPVSFNLIDKFDFNSKCRQIKAWLNGDIADNKLVFSDDIDYFYKVKYVKMNNDIERSLKVLGKFTVTFVCEPFCYMEEGLNSITLTQSTSIFNQGTYKSKPIIKVYGSGAITLNVNSNIIYLTNVDEYVTIDSNFVDCYKVTVPKNNDMDGEFPEFSVGSNGISWTGTVTKIEIQPNWRCL